MPLAHVFDLCDKDFRALQSGERGSTDPET